MNVVCVCVCDGRKPECLLFCSSHSAVVRVRELTTVAYLPHAVAPRLSSRYLCLSVMPIHRMVFGVCDSYVLWAVWPWLVLTHKTAAQAMCFAWTAFLHRFHTRNTIHSHKCISYAVDVSAHTYTHTHSPPTRTRCRDMCWTVEAGAMPAKRRSKHNTLGINQQLLSHADISQTQQFVVALLLLFLSFGVAGWFFVFPSVGG